MLRLSDICPGDRVCPLAQDARVRTPGCDGECHRNPCQIATCSCGLPWDPYRGPHTLRGLRLTPEVVSRIRAREGEAIAAEESAKAFAAADEAKRANSPEAIVLWTLAGLRFVRRGP